MYFPISLNDNTLSSFSDQNFWHLFFLWLTCISNPLVLLLNYISSLTTSRCFHHYLVHGTIISHLGYSKSLPSRLSSYISAVYLSHRDQNEPLKMHFHSCHSFAQCPPVVYHLTQGRMKTSQCPTRLCMIWCTENSDLIS